MVLTSDVLTEKTSYFREALDFFDQYKWIFDFSNTEILVRDVLTHIPEDWVDVFSHLEEELIASYPEDLFVNKRWPSSLQYFTTSCEQLRLNISTYQCHVHSEISKTLQKGIGDKKMHEIVTLSAFINEKCKKNNIGCCVDIGSGVGYLDEVLVTNYNFRVVGLECDEKKINSALKRISKQNKTSSYLEKLKYICTYVENPERNSSSFNQLDDKMEEEVRELNKVDILKRMITESDNTNRTSLHSEANRISKENNTLEYSDLTEKAIQESNMGNSSDFSINSVRIEEHVHAISVHTEEAQLDYHRTTVTDTVDLQSILPKEPFCLIGLHTCGDLSISVIKHFFSMSYAQQLIYIPCCYHRLKPNTQNTRTTFDNFPLSQSLKQVYGDRQILKIPFLRLATQETAASWRNYSSQQKDEMAFQLLFRSVLQLYADKENLKLIKKVRRPLKLNRNQNDDFANMITQTVEGYDLHCKATNKKVDWNTELLTRLWQENKNKRYLVKVLLILQNSIQSSAESLVLLDRLKFLHENGMKNIEVVQLFHQLVSPRRYCFVVGK